MAYEMKFESNPDGCVNQRLRGNRTCVECYYSQVRDNKWMGSHRCFDANCFTRVAVFVPDPLDDELMEDDELVRCPICGGHPQRESNNSYNGDQMDDWEWFAVYCLGCGARTKDCDTTTEAIDEWNSGNVY